MPVIPLKLNEMKEVRRFTIAKLNEITSGERTSHLNQSLGLSNQTLKQAKAFSKILSSARIDAMSNDFQDIGHVNKDVDIVFQLESVNPVYYFAANIANWHKEQTKGALFLNISIVQENKMADGNWLASYIMAGHDSTASINVGASELYPEKQMLLNFWFTKNQMEGPEILKILSGPKTLRKHILFAGTVLRNGIMHIDFQYDGLEHAQSEARRAYIGNLAQKHSKFLKKRGNFTFSILELGTTNIGGRQHWVYTGSEKTF